MSLAQVLKSLVVVFNRVIINMHLFFSSILFFIISVLIISFSFIFSFFTTQIFQNKMDTYNFPIQLARKLLDKKHVATQIKRPQSYKMNLVVKKRERNVGFKFPMTF